jgi:hypothetical protein
MIERFVVDSSWIWGFLGFCNVQVIIIGFFVLAFNSKKNNKTGIEAPCPKVQGIFQARERSILL